ncbi:MAG: transcription antitermination factor NusB [Planctomycetes bacterium]|jgi:N utilization substance protein B|nr:transcription antitermination factor NusB [Planctomycetota bacterium]
MTAPIRRRTRAREVALQLLFQFDLRGDDYAEQLGKTLSALCADECQGEADMLEFTVRLVEGTLGHRTEIDQRLQSVTRNWDLRRMANVDRNVLRMALYELMFCRDVPPKVAINEAIELGKKYSTANSGGFVNGILDRVRLDLEKERANPTQKPQGVAAGHAHSQPKAEESPKGLDSLGMDA